jgi:hypothetical protein
MKTIALLTFTIVFGSSQFGGPVATPQADPFGSQTVFGWPSFGAASFVNTGGLDHDFTLRGGL